jgi:hypothetical protein
MPGFQPMSRQFVFRWSRRLILLVVGAALLLSFHGEPARGAALQPTTISVSMSNPTCAEAIPANGSCSLEFNSLIASGSDASFSRIELLVNGKLRTIVDGFFESSAYVNEPMLPGGLKVACGLANEGGLPGYGRSYLVTANAYMADGTSASDSMTVYCPAYDGRTFLPMLRRK